MDSRAPNIKRRVVVYQHVRHLKYTALNTENLVFHKAVLILIKAQQDVSQRHVKREVGEKVI